MLLSKNLFKFPIAMMLGLSSIAHADNDRKLQRFLKDFHENPKDTMNKIPEKKQLSGNSWRAPKFSRKEIYSKSYLTKKDKIRQKIIMSGNKYFRGASPFSEYYGNDNPQNLLDNPGTYVDNIRTIDTLNIASSKLPFQPWSSSYWPLLEGSITSRYSDQNKPRSNIQQYAKYILEDRPAEELVKEGKENFLSPAEKYDLLMGDKKYSLTNSILNSLKNAGKLEGWEGICHGWAPAAYMYNRPVRSIKVANPEGKNITFYPADIKALSSLLWANLSYPSKFIGGRCNEKNPPRDPNGRVLSQDCFDTNPGTFHLSLINHVGINKHGFVFDATYDFQVWNQPILSYSYSYFNPETGKTSNRSSDVMIPKESFTRDKFKSYRSNKGTNIVGVKTRIEYVSETRPDANGKDGPYRDSIVAVEYIYDLEVESNGKIIGGEWYHTAHPDFIWTPLIHSDVSTNVVPKTENNNNIYMYHNYIWQENPTRPVPEWVFYSEYAAQHYRVPLEKIVRSLNAWASVDVNGQTPENCTQPCVPKVYQWHHYGE